MNQKNIILLEGYSFEITGFFCKDGTTTVTVCVSGNGSASDDLSSWVLELCPDQPAGEVSLVSCEKRREHSAWVSAAAQKASYEFTGDIDISGVMIEERVGKEIDDPDLEFRLVFDQEVESGLAGAAYISGETIYKSVEKIRISGNFNSRRWCTPIEKPFCLFMIVPDGYRLVNPCKANVSILKKGIFIAYETADPDMEDIDMQPDMKAVKTDVLGSIKIMVSVPLKSHHASGDAVSATTCDCFEVNETVCYTSQDKKIDMRNIQIFPKKKSLDMTLLNAHCGKSVYRLDGIFVIDCKRCEL